MFDPVHLSHIAAARFAVSHLDLDKLLLVPCATPNHRDPATANAEQRLQMLRLASADYRDLEVDDREIRREGVSYTVDTLAELREKAECEQLVFVLGMDAFKAFTEWHDWQRILTLSHLLVLHRDGELPAAELADEVELSQREVADADALFASPAGNILLAQDFTEPVSSTEVRRSLRMNENTEAMLDEKVRLFIEDHRLYR